MPAPVLTSDDWSHKCAGGPTGRGLVRTAYALELRAILHGRPPPKPFFVRSRVGSRNPYRRCWWWEDLGIICTNTMVQRKLSLLILTQP